MCREAIVSEPYNFRVRSPERGQVWDSIAAHLNSLNQPKFKVTGRAVRDRYTLLTSRHKQKLRDEEKASGIEIEETELDILLEDILEREKNAKEKIDEQSAEKKAKAAQEKEAAEEIRLQALQTLKDKGKRKSEDENQKGPKMRRRTSDAIEFLVEKAEKDRELKMEELKIKNREVEIAAAKQDEAAKQQQSMLASLMQQMERQQQLQQQNIQAMLAQQNNLLMAMLQNSKNNSK